MSQTFRAHFDGEHIILDEPVELQPNTKLLVTVLPSDIEHEEWLAVSRRNLELACHNQEAEYTLDRLKEANPAYKPLR